MSIVGFLVVGFWASVIGGGVVGLGVTTNNLAPTIAGAIVAAIGAWLLQVGTIGLGVKLGRDGRV